MGPDRRPGRHRLRRLGHRVRRRGGRRAGTVPGRDARRPARAAVAAIRTVPGVILPFPGGVVRSGSKVGSKYKGLRASTNDAYCPTLRGAVASALPEGVNAVYEIVIDGLDLAAVEEATRVGVRAACRPGVVRITAGNYGGKLGPFHLHLHKLLGPSESKT